MDKMTATPRHGQAQGNGDDSAQRRMMMRSFSYPSADSSPDSMASSEGGGARLSVSSIASVETASRGIPVRVSRSIDTVDMRVPTRYSEVTDSDHARIARTTNLAGFPGHALAHFQIGHKSNRDKTVKASASTKRKHKHQPVQHSTDLVLRSAETAAAMNTKEQYIPRGADDPQVIYPTTACVFVANLPEARDDLALEAAVTRAFSRFGTVFVKIRRDISGNMPFAFAQFTNERDALQAEAEGKGTTIFGRPCRTEMAKSNRTYILYKANRDAMSIQEAGDLLFPYGAFNNIERLDPEISRARGIAEAVLIEFLGFNQNRDLANDMRNNAITDDPNMRIEVYDPKRHRGRAARDEFYLRQYDVDRRSVFVCNLPPATTEQLLWEFFGAIGPIVKIDVVVRRNDPTGPPTKTFAFVEFVDHRSATEAIATKDASLFLNCFIKVQKKETKAANQATTPTRVASMGHPPPMAGTPTRPMGNHPDSLGQDATIYPGGRASSGAYHHQQAQAYYQPQMPPMAPAMVPAQHAGYPQDPGPGFGMPVPPSPTSYPAMSAGWSCPPGMVPFYNPATGVFTGFFPMAGVPGMPGIPPAPGAPSMPVTPTNMPPPSPMQVSPSYHQLGGYNTLPLRHHASESQLVTPTMGMPVQHPNYQADSSGNQDSSDDAKPARGRSGNTGRRPRSAGSAGSTDSGSPIQRGAQLN